MLATIHPTQGKYCVAVAATQGFHHKFFDNLDDALACALRLDAAGRTVYMAQASFKTDENRKGTNAAFARAFWLDIDCGEGKPYATQRDGAAAVLAFVKQAGLPMPIITNSGGGLYAHWPITTDVPANIWKTVAIIFKQLTVAYGLQADPTRTADISSVLRPWGSTNRKPGRDERTVAIINHTMPDSTSLRDFADALARAAKKVNLKPTIHQAPKPQADDEFTVYQPIASFGEEIAEHCEQVRQMRDTQGDVNYEHWRGVIGLLKHCEDGWELAHLWSSRRAETGHTNIDPAPKWETWTTGPATCVHFHNCNPDGCIGCRSKDRIKSPIILGRPMPTPLPVSEETGIEPPTGFVRDGEGLYYVQDELKTKFFNSDLYPVALAFDESLGYETMVLRHKMPHSGWREFTIRSSLVHDSRGLLTALTDNHVHIVGVKERKLMGLYIESYAEKLQRAQRTGRLHCQMGWKEIDGQQAFVLGKRIFFQDGRIEDASLAHNIPAAANSFKTNGELRPWVESTRHLNAPGMEPLAFAFLAGAFGAPLLKFTGYDGAMVCTMGRSGVGKTLTARWIQSVYGEHDRLMMLRDDTKNALVSRLGVYGNLPLTVDEITNIDAAELSDLVYRVTQGRDKARLSRNAVERAQVNHWNTLAVVSSNSSLAERLAGLKMDASAELNRLFEYEAAGSPLFGRHEATQVFRTISENYGHAGELFVAKIVRDYDNHRENLDKLIRLVEARARTQMDERFWTAIIGVAIYGGMIAKNLGLIQFDVARVMEWAIAEVAQMSRSKGDFVTDPVGVLGMFLDEHVQNRVIMDKGHAGRGDEVMQDVLRSALFVRVEMHHNRIFISRARFREWLQKKGGNYTQVRRGLELLGILLDSNKRKVLGAGTAHSGGAQPCLEINMKSPNLGTIAAVLVEDAKAAVR